MIGKKAFTLELNSALQSPPKVLIDEFLDVKFSGVVQLHSGEVSML